MGCGMENIFVAHLGVASSGTRKSGKDGRWWEKVVQLGKASRNRKFQLRDVRGFHMGCGMENIFVAHLGVPSSGT